MQQIINYKTLWLLIILFLTTSCTRSSHHDTYYYLRHPEVLKLDYANCQQGSSKSADCKVTEQSHQEIMAAVLSAQSNPQEFGTGIIKLQYELSQLQQQLSTLMTDKERAAKDPKQYQQQISQLKQQITQNKYKNHLYLSIVRWLESPET